MADSYVNGQLTSTTPYTVPTGKVLAVIMYGNGSGDGTISAGFVTKPANEYTTQSPATTRASKIVALVSAGGVLSTTSAASYSGVLRDA